MKDQKNPRKPVPILSLSGGMDSSALLLHALAGFGEEEIYSISFDYGQRHKIELECLARNVSLLREKGFVIYHTVVDISILGELFESSLTTEGWEPPEGHYAEETMKETVVPNRNAIFSSILFGYALSISKQLDRNAALCLGVHSGDHAIYPDCRPEFYSALHEAFQIGNWDAERVEFYLPYLEGDKFTILKDAEASCNQLGINFDEYFSNTNTSYSPDEQGRASGKTGSDVERILAFDKLGRIDPIEYQEPWEIVVKRARELESNQPAGVSDE